MDMSGKFRYLKNLWRALLPLVKAKVYHHSCYIQDDLDFQHYICNGLGPKPMFMAAHRFPKQVHILCAIHITCKTQNWLERERKREIIDGFKGTLKLAEYFQKSFKQLYIYSIWDLWESFSFTLNSLENDTF